MSDNFDLLDATLDDLADLPQQSPFPAGCHVATMFISLPTPKPGKKQGVMVKFKYKESKELTDVTAVPPNPGDEALMFISLYKKDGTTNDIGQGQLKMLLKPLADAGLSGSPRELIEAAKPGIDVVIVNTVGEYNGNPQMNLKKIEVVA